MAIDNRFDFLRMDFLASDVDDSVPAACEVVAVSAKLDEIARIDEAIVSSNFGI